MVVLIVAVILALVFLTDAISERLSKSRSPKEEGSGL